MSNTYVQLLATTLAGSRKTRTLCSSRIAQLIGASQPCVGGLFSLVRAHTRVD